MVGSGAHFIPAPARTSSHLLGILQTYVPARLFQCVPGHVHPAIQESMLFFSPSP